MFAVDDALDAAVSNDAVYRSTVQPLVATIFKAGKATCFAYGQTGAALRDPGRLCLQRPDSAWWCHVCSAPKGYGTNAEHARVVGTSRNELWELLLVWV